MCCDKEEGKQSMKMVQFLPYMNIGNTYYTTGNQPPRGPRGDGATSRQHTRNRRTHRRVTHNEKRYHSGI